MRNIRLGRALTVRVAVGISVVGRIARLMTASVLTLALIRSYQPRPEEQSSPRRGVVRDRLVSGWPVALGMAGLLLAIGAVLALDGSDT